MAPTTFPTHLCTCGTDVACSQMVAFSDSLAKWAFDGAYVHLGESHEDANLFSYWVGTTYANEPLEDVPNLRLAVQMWRESLPASA